MPRPRLDHVRKAQIVTAAIDVMNERGYANARVADIAEAAGTSPAAILYWFSGKEELLNQALLQHEVEFHDKHTARAERQQSASDRLRFLFKAMVRHYHWALWMELCVLALRDETAAATRDRLDRRWRAALRKVIREGQQSGEFVDGDSDAIMFILAGLLDGFAPLLAVRAKGVTRARVERVWLQEASRLLGPNFSTKAL